MDDDDAADYARVDSWLQSTVPSIPKCAAVLCLILNIIIPGSGTITGGLISCCCGRPRYDFRPAKMRCPTSLLVIMIGFAQLVSTVFMLVGWLWSIIWGVLMVNLSGEEFRKTPSPPPDPRARRELKVEVIAPAEPKNAPETDEETTRGKKNFMKLVSKAADNKDQAIHGPSPSLSSPAMKSVSNLKTNLIGSPNAVVMDPKQLTSKSTPADTLDSVKLSSSKKSLTFVNEISAAPAIIEVEESGMAEKEEGTPMSIGSKYSIFGCFRAQDHNSMLHEMFIKMMRGGSVKDSQMHWLQNSDSPTFSHLKSKGEGFIGFIHQYFKHWKNRAKEAARSRLKNSKVENVVDHNDVNEPESITVISDGVNDTDHIATASSLVNQTPVHDFDHFINEDKTDEPITIKTIKDTTKAEITKDLTKQTRRKIAQNAKVISHLKHTSTNLSNRTKVKPMAKITKPNVTPTGQIPVKVIQKRPTNLSKTNAKVKS